MTNVTIVYVLVTRPSIKLSVYLHSISYLLIVSVLAIFYDIYLLIILIISEILLFGVLLLPTEGQIGV